MKRVGVLLLFICLGGCGSYHTLEELDDQAILTGDWSEVEYREAKMARWRPSARAACPSGLMMYCVDPGGDKRCSCVSANSFRDSPERW